MSDRDKVIEELKELCEYLFHEYKVCYHGDEEDTYNRFLSANNALELLKEQEAVKPIVEQYALPLTLTSVRFIKKYYCGICKEEITGNNVYCHKCGRKVMWDAAD